MIGIDRDRDRAANPRALYDKVRDDHVIATRPDGTSSIRIDRHLIHEVTTPQAFEGLRVPGRTVHIPNSRRAGASL